MFHVETSVLLRPVSRVKHFAKATPSLPVRHPNARLLARSYTWSQLSRSFHGVPDLVRVARRGS